MASNNKKGDKKHILIISLLVIVLVIGISFAYFIIQSSSDIKTITTGDLKLSFDDSTEIINAENIRPIYEDQIKKEATKKTFSILSTNSDASQYVTIKLTDIDIDPELSNSDFRWALYENNTFLATSTFENVSTNEEVSLISNVEMEKNATKTYDLYLYILENNDDQNSMMNKSFSAQISAIGYLKPIINE